MKKFISMLLCVVMFAIPMFAGAESDSMPMAGGWNTEIADNAAGFAAFEKATGNLIGAEYEPIAVLADQLVAGTNYCVLCKISTVTINVNVTYALVYVYESLTGECSVTDFVTLAEPANEALCGGYAPTYDWTVDEAAFAQATSMLMGASYQPIAAIESQVVAGTNTGVLCKITPVVPDAVGHYAIATIYTDLEGNSSLVGVVDLAIGIN